MQSALALQTADDAGKHTTAAGNRGPLVYGFGDEPAEGTKAPDADDDDDGRRVPVTALHVSSVHSTKDVCLEWLVWPQSCPVCLPLL